MSIFNAAAISLATTSWVPCLHSSGWALRWTLRLPKTSGRRPRNTPLGARRAIHLTLEWRRCRPSRRIKRGSSLRLAAQLSADARSEPDPCGFAERFAAKLLPWQFPSESGKCGCAGVTWRFRMVSMPISALKSRIMLLISGTGREATRREFLSRCLISRQQIKRSSLFRLWANRLALKWRRCRPSRRIKRVPTRIFKSRTTFQIVLI